MRPARSGFSLIEILVATGVMVAVILPILLAFTQSVRMTEVSLDEIVATNLAEEIADQILVVPYVSDFGKLLSHPVVNPPIEYPHWAPPLAASGLALPPALPGLAMNVDTRGFTLTGVPYMQSDTPPGLESFHRLYLSQLPDRFSRRAKVHRVTDRVGSSDENPNMVQVEVEVSWEDRALAGPHPKRLVTIKAIVANPTLGWGGL